MSTFDFFEQIDEQNYNRPSKPIWALDLKNEEEVLKWLNGEVSFLIDKSKDRLRRIRKNLALYKGIQYETQEDRRDLRDRSVDRSRAVPKIVVNHLYDLTQNRVAKLVKYKPGVAIMPSNDEFEDKISAKVTKSLLDHIWYEEHFQDELVYQVARDAAVMGESYLWITWNPNKGDLHPDSPKDGERVALIDENGKPLKDEDGKTLYIDKKVRVGDVDYEVVLAPDVFVERKQRLSDCNYVFRRKIKTVEELRYEYPDKASKIKASKEAKVFDYETFEIQNLNNEVVVWEFYHKSTSQMEDGRYCVFTNDVVLLNEELPYSHGELPFERYTDIDVPGEIHGMSFFETVKALTSSYNNLTNMVLRNQYLVAHPKWMMPAGAANIESLGNDITVVQFKGPQPPVLVQASPTPPEVMTMLTSLKEQFQQISGIFGVSRGEPPPGIKSGVALQFLNEQENERFNAQILKWNELIRKVAIKTIAVCGDYYDESDQRMGRVLGKNNDWMTVFFDAAHLSKDYDIRIENSSALPQSKAARTQYLMDLAEKFPDEMSGKQVLDLLDLSQPEKFIDVATAALRAAEAENELLMTTKDDIEPKEYEDHIQHWKIHVSALQQYKFKNQTPKAYQDRLINHILVTEMFMWQKSLKSPVFAEELATLSMWPVFFVVPDMTPVEPPALVDQAPPQSPVQPQAPLNEMGLGAAGTPQPINPDEALTPELPVQPGGEPLPPEPGAIEPTSNA